MLLSSLISLKILIFIISFFVVVISVCSLTSDLSFAQYDLHEVFIEIDLGHLLQNVFELVLAGYFKGAAFKIQSLPHVIQFTSVEFD